MISSSKNSVHSGSLLVKITLLFWAAIALLAGHSLYSSVSWPKTILAWPGLSLFLISIHLLWALLAHMLACVFIKLLNRPLQEPVQEENCNEDTPIAILLCTRDDWMHSTALSCLSAMRQCDHLYICDDSESAEFHNQIDQFAQSHANKCTVIRRKSLQGWKAGNLNHCLKSLPKYFAYFMVVDHDNLISTEIIQRGIGHFRRDSNLAFVQFPHEEDFNFLSSFGRDLQPSIRSIWWTLSLRKIHGFRFTLGHTVLFRSEFIKKLGGFPENIVTEDIAITMRLLNEGCTGVYDLSLSAKESIPDTYKKYRSRYVRWCIGTLQSWFDPKTRLSKSKVPLHILFDGALLSLNLLYAFPLFILALGLWLTSSNISHSIAYAGLTFKVITVLSLLCPNLPLLYAARKSGKTLHYLAVNTAVYLSMVIPTVVSVISALLFRRSDFINTGNRTTSDKWSLTQPIYKLFGANGLGTILIECVIFVWFIMHAKNIGLVGFLFLSGVIFGPLFTLFRWDSWLITIIKYIPIIFILIASILLLVPC